MTILLGAYAARSCAVKTHNAHNASLDPELVNSLSGRQPDEALQELFDGGEDFEREVDAELLAAFGGSAADLRSLRDQPWATQQQACLSAMRDGVELIVGAALPTDLAGHRTGQVDLLIRGADQASGTPGYHPAEIKWHKIRERKPLTKTPRANTDINYTTLVTPSPEAIQIVAGLGFRIATREADLIQLSHYWRMLQGAGFAAPGPAWVAIIGTDLPAGERQLTWVDLDQPLVRTFSRSQADGWTNRSILERYDHEHGFRVQVASIATQLTGNPDVDPAPKVFPIVTAECGRCPWWEHCLPQLDPDDVSLKIDKRALDVREISTLRAQGITTITDLAGADVEQLLAWYLPEVTHRSGAEGRIRLAVRRARLLAHQVDLERETIGPIEVPGADLEIDFDIETSANGRVYLWGFLVNDTRVADPPHFEHFSRFDDLDTDSEHRLAVQAMSWLRGLVDGNQRVAVYHYSNFEVAKINELAQRTPDTVLDWAGDYAENEFVDLYEIVKQHFFGVRGLGLKIVATKGAGFCWRDDDPGGLNSQRWFAESVHAESPEIRALAKRRVLEYNEDDVIATAAVRRWLRAQTGPASQIGSTFQVSSGSEALG